MKTHYVHLWNEGRNVNRMTYCDRYIEWSFEKPRDLIFTKIDDLINWNYERWLNKAGEFPPRSPWRNINMVPCEICVNHLEVQMKLLAIV